ncbi:PD-(D/E)XK nuclease family protein [Flavobacterium sp. ACAM 123]|uniref:PDDEXK-like family protein n=1 Tax=Flavobacterium sp. ACAM 123 TaxID=1189620 RepID=UPI0002E2160B|nr:PD-(D/E)XK nuclease family protein [Flavobacterium sp. ACAM 123]
MENDISSIELLIGEYDALKIVFEQERIDEDIPKYESLLDDFGVMKKEYHTWNHIEAEKYNIFNILNIRHGETKTHTPYLINLLNPKASHAQGLVFFNLFINAIAPDSKKHLYKNLEPKNIRLKEEKCTEDGRLDIFIESIGVKEKFVIVIENKINALDQTEQLSRYYNHCKKSGFTDANILLIYLTRRGCEASDFSMLPLDRERLKNHDVLVYMSYRHDVKNIMKKYIEELQSNKVRFIAQQYLDIIKTF